VSLQSLYRTQENPPGQSHPPVQHQPQQTVERLHFRADPPPRHAPLSRRSPRHPTPPSRPQLRVHTLCQAAAAARRFTSSSGRLRRPSVR